MKTMMTVSRPNDVDFTLEVTMTLKEWKALREVIGEDGVGVGWKLKASIRDMVYQAAKDFRPTDLEGDDE